MKYLFYFILSVSIGILGFSAATATAATNDFRGVNWADERDNFQDGVIYLSGLDSSDTYESASIVADRVVGQFVSLLGSNTVRMPINESTVFNYWGTYTGAIDKTLEKGKVILCYWAPSNGKPSSMSDFYEMWSTVIDRYADDSNCYFEPINEPYGYSSADLCNFYNDFCNYFLKIPKDRMILDGAGYAQNVQLIGNDSRLDGCLLAVHDYSFFGNLSWLTETQWKTHFQNEVGDYSDRTICTEWGCMMSAGIIDGVSYEKHDYSLTIGDYFFYYCRAISSQLREWNMGSMYWPGLRDGDTYSMTVRTGEGENILLSIVNQSGLDRLKYSWGDDISDTERTIFNSYILIDNRSTNLCIDGMGRNTNGSNAALYSRSYSANQQWLLESVGDYYKIKNRTTGLYLDGAGRTENGSIVVQYGNSASYNQQWNIETDGNYFNIINRATGMYIDGVGATSNGYDLKQYGSSASYNQDWNLIVP
jgi:hypothetical protein